MLSATPAGAVRAYPCQTGISFLIATPRHKVRKASRAQMALGEQPILSTPKPLVILVTGPIPIPKIAAPAHRYDTPLLPIFIYASLPCSNFLWQGSGSRRTHAWRKGDTAHVAALLGKEREVDRPAPAAPSLRGDPYFDMVADVRAETRNSVGSKSLTLE